MTEQEKKCLILSRRFLNEAKQQFGLQPRDTILELTLATEGTMLGQIAAQKYENCIRGQSQPTKPVSR